MKEFFLNVVNMSISASFILLAVLLLRLILRKAPKWITLLLWGIVAIRLICPFTVESKLSLIPETEWVKPPEVQVSDPIVTDVIVQTPVLGENVTVEDTQKEPNITIKKGVDFYLILSCIWLAGIAALSAYTVISYLRLSKKVGTAVLYRDNVYQSENVTSPFVLGLFKPKIYLPFNINTKDIEHVVAHERAHIRRKDHFWKPLGFLLLTIHWFNPLLWLGYILLCRDIELACDEKVVKDLDRDARADYSEALLSCSVNRRMISACPLAFGEVGVKDRVKSVLNYKKPAFWIIMIAILACVSVAVCFLTDPIGTDTSVNDGLKAFIDTQVLEHFRTEKSEGKACCYDWIPLGKTERGSETTVYMWVMYQEYSYIGTELKMETAAHIPTAITVKEADGQYELVEYWEPKDGANYPTSLKRKFPRNILNSEAFTSRLYSEEQTEKCLQQARIYFGLDHLSGTQSERGLICSFLPPNSTSGKMHYVYIQDFGCNVADVRIDFKEVRFEDGKIVFEIYWENSSTKDVAIGPDFEVYKYNGTSLEELEHKNVWLYYRQSVTGKGTCVAGDLDGLTIVNDISIPYSVSAHYDIFSPGRYRFEAHGAWVEFAIIDDYNYIAPEYDSEIFDVDGDGDPEMCSMHSGYLGNYQNFVFIVKDLKTGKTECETVIYTQVQDLSFARWIDNTVRVKGRTPDKNPMDHWFEISIVDGNVCLTEKGLPIEEVGKVAMIYDNPVYSYVMPPEAVPKIEFENGIIYTVSEGKRERYGTVKAVDITNDNFDSFTIISEQFTSPRFLRENNETAYEVTPDSEVGIGLYYIMEQKSGETLIVYGHYEDSKKVGVIRFIYSVKE
ncbi:MAG: M56 family metallopeptidase [Clostridia bacterium]|nr:M56 family metallopeptidase [Clostridia bacterium]